MSDSWFRKPRSWHRTLPQSLENPLQVDRLPSTSTVELEFPVVQHTPAENWRHVAWILGIAFAIGLISMVGQFGLTILRGTQYYQGLLASIGLLVFLTQIPLGKLTYRLLLCVLVWPMMAGVLLTAGEAHVVLGLGILLGGFLADRFAAHLFYLKTAMPMPRNVAARLRRFWSLRFSPRLVAARGLELYWLSILAFPAVFALLLWYRLEIPESIILPYMPSLLLAFVLLLLCPVAVEALASFLTARPRQKTVPLFRSFGSAVVHWFTYNRKRSESPGVFQSPAGNCRQRKFMSLGVVTVLAAGTSQLFFSLPSSSNLSNEPTPPQPSPTPEINIPAWGNEPFPSEIFEPDAEPFGASTSLPRIHFVMYSRPESPVPEDFPEELQLEPWQEGLLRRAGPEQREKYLRQWADQARRNSQEDDKTKRKAADDATSPSDKLDSMSRVIAGVAFFIGMYTLFGSMFPLLWWLAACFNTSASVVGFYASHFDLNSPDELLDSETWSQVISRLRQSNDDVERDSLFLGVNAYDGSPVVVPRRVFHEHAHLLGDSGAGKTSIGLAGLISQLIQFGDASLVVIDLKADDLALFRNTRVEARRVQMRLRRDDPEASYRFRWFTPEIDHSTYVFNPLQQEHFRRLTLYQRADVLTAAFGLRYGSEYGRSHFADANTELLFEALQHCPNPASFEELARLLSRKDLFSKKLLDDASHLNRVVQRLSACQPLNAMASKAETAGAMDHAIDLADVFRVPQVVYYHLPSAIGVGGVGEIARLALYSLLSAARHVGDQRKQVFLLIDEFQIMAAPNLEFILQTARSMNVGIILANQSLHNLELHGKSLIPTIRACTRLRQVFAASDLEDQRELIAVSGETLVHSRAWSQYLGAMVGVAGGRSVTASEQVSPRLRPNDILLASDHPRQSILHLRRGDGYAQFGGMPFVMTSTHHISFDRYEKRKKSSWPKTRPGETIMPDLRMPTITTAVPLATDPDSQPDPVISDDESGSGKGESLTGGNKLLDRLWEEHEKQQAKQRKLLKPYATQDHSSDTPSAEGEEDDARPTE